jgi:L-alanine-DL-glutamate epimerase-like enolase superfamily enzyme
MSTVAAPSHAAEPIASAAPGEACIEKVSASAYRIPTHTPEESDGTLVWDSTELALVEVRSAGHTGIGYTYCDASAAHVVECKLAGVIEGADAFMPERCWAKMQVEARQLGHAGIAAMAISAVDVALWDLKAKLLGVCLADALPRYHESVPIYASGGFTSYDEDELREQVRGWAELGFSSLKIKVGREKDDDVDRVALVRDTVGPDVEIMVDGNGAYEPQEALRWGERYVEQGVAYFEEPVSSQDLAGLAALCRRAPGGLAIAAGEYGWNLPYFQRMLDAEAVHILQADVTRCGGITNMLRVDGLCKARQTPFSAHCAPAISVHACAAMESVLHIEYFFDHYRIEGMLFDGTLDPHEGLLTPDRARPGLGLELKRAEAERYQVHPAAS